MNLLVERGEDLGTFFLRPFTSDGQRFDQLLRLILQLALPTGENAQLLLQRPGSGFLGASILGSETVERSRFSPQSVYWVGLESGRLLRFDGNDAAGDAPIRVDFSAFGAKQIMLPQVSAQPLMPRSSR